VVTNGYDLLSITFPAMAGVCAKQTLLRDSGAAQSIAADFGILMKDAIPDMAVGHKSSHAGSLT